MPKIDDQLISRLEKLSHLNLDDSEKQKIQKDLNSIVEMFDKLQEVNTDGVEPLKHMMNQVNFLRDDQITGELTNEQALKNTPKTSGGFIAVPKFLKPK